MNKETVSIENDFLAVRVGVASPDQIAGWSFGEVTKPETINYRTLRPEKDGLFDERIFGPTKDWECYCGKYKKIRYKGIVCDKCGVEVTRSAVRRERMGHIQLAAPVSHIWYLRGTPSRIGLALDVPARRLEQVIYFAAYIITSVDDDARTQAQSQLEQEYKAHVAKLKGDHKAGKFSEAELEEKLDKFKLAYQTAQSELKDIKIKKVLSETEYRNLSLKYGQVFRAGIGAEAVYQLTQEIDLEAEIAEVKEALVDATGQKQKRLMKRIRLLESMNKANLHPGWMFVTTLPVIPPDLRPMVQLDGGRFATSDLNDLYRRVINRNNRLKKLIEIGAPEVIARNEKRMLQEAVDALFDITARETSATNNSKRQLKSLSDMLKGKQGRFRQNLLGKRVDYSGRSVIVVGPTLKLHECGIPKAIALELFKPFVISKLMAEDIVHNVKTAGKLVEKETPEVWDALDSVIGHYYVLLNRAPTLHRLGIQAFRPVLVEGNAIQLHPLACNAFNADFDGDQMAIHLPLSEAAQSEAENIMLATNNLLKPATGEPIVMADQDMILGSYYLTIAEPEGDKVKSFSDLDDAMRAHVAGKLKLQTIINVPVNGEVIKTTLGRLIFNSILPVEWPYLNDTADKKVLKRLIHNCYRELGQDRTVDLVNDIKDTGFQYSTMSGATFSASDLEIPGEKNTLIATSNEQVATIKDQFKEGLITAGERRRMVIGLWEKTKKEVEHLLKGSITNNPFVPTAMMVTSGARGSLEQFNQMIGMVGVKINAAGEAMELPVKSNYKEGLDSLEYFLSTHGARKGLSDTALRTSDAGYLTRRLVDVCQDIVVTEEDCGDTEGFTLFKNSEEMLGDPFAKRIEGRYLAADVIDGSKTLGKAGDEITEEMAQAIEDSDVDAIQCRSSIACRSDWGVCQKCYGKDLARGTLVKIGEAVGIIAAQSIGEPGTQLTMRTFHTGGVASTADITQGLPRVEELFEARNPKAEAIMAPMDGMVAILEVGNKKMLRVEGEEDVVTDFKVLKSSEAKVKDGDKVKKGETLVVLKSGEEVTAPAAGTVTVTATKVALAHKRKKAFEYQLTARSFLRVEDGQKVKKADQLTEGQLNLKDLLELTGVEKTQHYVISEIQKIYNLQGQNINDKHIEAVVRQMFSRIRVEDSGDSNLIVGETVDRVRFEAVAAKLAKDGKTPPTGTRLLLGVSKASLATDSFLSAASFQETTRVLVDAAVAGKVDYLRGLKENVIVGRLIPAGTGFRSIPGDPEA